MSPAKVLCLDRRRFPFFSSPLLPFIRHWSLLSHRPGVAFIVLLLSLLELLQGQQVLVAFPFARKYIISLMASTTLLALSLDPISRFVFPSRPHHILSEHQPLLFSTHRISSGNGGPQTDYRIPPYFTSSLFLS